MKKIVLKEEIVYILAIILLSFSVALIAASNFGVSMIVAPAYLISLKFTVLTFGQAEYVVQAIVFILLCLILKKFKFTYAFSFVTCIIYGGFLDLWRNVIPILNPAIYAPGEFNMYLRIIMFVVGVVLTSFSVALFFRVYLFPQVYDFFTKAVSKKFKIEISKFKRCFDLTCLVIALILSLAFFKEIKGIGIGTIIMTFINGILIGWFLKFLDKYFIFEPYFKKLKQKFEI